MLKVNGLLMIIVLCILDLVVSNGCHLCGLVASHNGWILNMKSYVGNPKIAKWKNSQDPSSCIGNYEFLSRSLYLFAIKATEV